MKFNEIICFPSIDWNHSWERQQELMYRLSIHYSDVNIKVIKPLGLINHNIINLLKKIQERFENEKKVVVHENKKTKNMNFINIFYIPIHFNRLFNLINYYLLSKKIEMNDNSLMWATYINGFTFIQFKKAKYKVLDLATRRQVNEELSTEAKLLEIEAIKIADCIFVDNYNTFLDYEKYNTNIYYVPQGVDCNNFSSDNVAEEYKYLKENKRYIVGYCGNLHQFVDYKLLESVISEMHNYIFMFVGNIMDSRAENLKQYQNVIFTGFKEHKELYKYYNLFDIGLIPYTVEPFTTGVYPTKFLEYTISNVPVLSSKLPDLERYNLDFLEIYEGKEEFIKKLEILKLRKVNKNDIKEFIEKNTWDNRFEVIISEMKKIK